MLDTHTLAVWWTEPHIEHHHPINKHTPLHTTQTHLEGLKRGVPVKEVEGVWHASQVLVRPGSCCNTTIGQKLCGGASRLPWLGVLQMVVVGTTR